jgi:hypothetical protein
MQSWQLRAVHAVPVCVCVPQLATALYEVHSRALASTRNTARSSIVLHRCDVTHRVSGSWQGRCKRPGFSCRASAAVKAALTTCMDVPCAASNRALSSSISFLATTPAAVAVAAVL